MSSALELQFFLVKNRWIKNVLFFPILKVFFAFQQNSFVFVSSFFFNQSDRKVSNINNLLLNIYTDNVKHSHWLSNTHKNWSRSSDGDFFFLILKINLNLTINFAIDIAHFPKLKKICKKFRLYGVIITQMKLVLKLSKLHKKAALTS